LPVVSKKKKDNEDGGDKKEGEGEDSSNPTIKLSCSAQSFLKKELLMSGICVRR
jgi:hypothetical protein